jgi:hypothetical protein
VAETESQGSAENPREKEANDRLKEARRWKETRALDFKEAYFFSAPWRQRQVTSTSKPASGPMQDQPELNTDLGFIMVGDFVTEVVNTYMPEAQLWCERKAGEGFEEPFEQIKDTVKAQDKAIFAAIKSSNFYAEIPKALNPDLAIGGAGLYVHRPRADRPIECLAMPMRKLEINLGPNGEIDDRFIVDWAYNKYVKTLIGEEAWKKVSDDVKKQIADHPTERTEVCWGWWRKWDDISDEVWCHVILVDQELVYEQDIKGEGCCPLIFMRFGATADWPWAHGPMLQGMPTLRQIDELERQKIDAVERAVSPPITFPDDSFTEVEQGVESGMAYRIRPGSENAVRAIYDQPTIEPEVYQIQTMEHRLRKLHYIDMPEQSGDTPPTLGQWLDEMARAQRRIGTPGMSFWREGPRAIFLRFKYLLERAGTLPKLEAKGGKAVSTQPYNPAQRAAEQQEIATAIQCASALGQMFPEEWRAAIDGRMTMEAFVDKMRTSGLLKFRKKEEVAQAVQQIAQLIGGRQRLGGEVPEGAGLLP